MYTLIIKIAMDENECVVDEDEIFTALRVLVGYTHVNISGNRLIGLMKQALEMGPLPTDADYETVED